ncbi:tyrosine aminotransferase-like [Corticium candelabrum]|uniref:tyrosine aminotransferase-like n=1 Tax=Corticium candelabrum TaxID=121492 RepID=UPI002E25A701|nr:tyrosine aminotransferase-like [Corticium candelabrum]
MSSKSESDTACNEARSSSDNGQRSTTEALYPPDAWNIVASTSALNTFNPIRSIVDQMKVQPNPDYEPIKLSIGDPSIYGGFEPCVEILDCVRESLYSGKHNGYHPSHGSLEARKAVAHVHSKPNQEISPNDVILTSGCSGAIDITLRALANPGDNVLIPTPGFSIYKTILTACGIEAREYYLLPEKSWQVDLEHLEKQIDGKTVAIVLNDPSNPCGSVYSSEHKQEIIQIAGKYHKPIVADEIYHEMVFSGHKYESVGSLAGDVPVLCCGGISKRYLVPGWRMGWIILHDRRGIMRDTVWPRMVAMTQVILGPCSIVQGALHEILLKTPSEFFQAVNKKIESHAMLCYDCLSKVDGLKPIMPQGSIYLMVQIDIKRFPNIKDDIDFTEKLVCAMSVHCLPGQCFRYRNYFRVVICAAKEKLEEACHRIKLFCEKNYVTE